MISGDQAMQIIICQVAPSKLKNVDSYEISTLWIHHKIKL